MPTLWLHKTILKLHMFWFSNIFLMEHSTIPNPWIPKKLYQTLLGAGPPWVRFLGAYMFAYFILKSQELVVIKKKKVNQKSTQVGRILIQITNLLLDNISKLMKLSLFIFFLSNIFLCWELRKLIDLYDEIMDSVHYDYC